MFFRIEQGDFDTMLARQLEKGDVDIKPKSPDIIILDSQDVNEEEDDLFYDPVDNVESTVEVKTFQTITKHDIETTRARKRTAPLSNVDFGDDIPAISTVNERNMSSSSKYNRESNWRLTDNEREENFTKTSNNSSSKNSCAIRNNFQMSVTDKDNSKHEVSNSTVLKNSIYDVSPRKPTKYDTSPRKSTIYEGESEVIPFEPLVQYHSMDTFNGPSPVKRKPPSIGRDYVPKITSHKHSPAKLLENKSKQTPKAFIGSCSQGNGTLSPHTYTSTVNTGSYSGKLSSSMSNSSATSNSHTKPSHYSTDRTGHDQPAPKCTASRQSYSYRPTQITENDTNDNPAFRHSNKTVMPDKRFGDITSLTGVSLQTNDIEIGNCVGPSKLPGKSETCSKSNTKTPVQRKKRGRVYMMKTVKRNWGHTDSSDSCDSTEFSSLLDNEDQHAKNNIQRGTTLANLDDLGLGISNPKSIKQKVPKETVKRVEINTTDSKYEETYNICSSNNERSINKCSKGGSDELNNSMGTDSNDSLPGLFGSSRKTSSSFSSDSRKTSSTSSCTYKKDPETGDEENVQLVSSILPHVPKNTIVRCLQQSNNNVELCVSLLLDQ